MAKRPPLIATALRVTAVVFAAAAATPSRRGRFGTEAWPSAFAAPRRPPRAPSPSLRAAADGPEGSVADPRDAWRRDGGDCDAPTSSWGVADDWGALSSSSSSFPSASAPPSPASYGGFDATDEATRLLEEQEGMLGEWESGAAEDDANGIGSIVNDMAHAWASNDDFVENAVDVIASRYDYSDPGDSKLYDTASSSASVEKDIEEEELSFMIRCNHSPQQFLVSEGRALPELTDEVKYSPTFLLEGATDAHLEQDDVGLPLQPKATAYFEWAVDAIFDAHSVEVVDSTPREVVNDDIQPRRTMSVLDRGAISRWMTKSMSSPLSSSNSKPHVIGPYDASVSALLSRYSQTHGSGRLTRPEFQALYLEVAWYGYVQDVTHGKAVPDGGRTRKVPSPGAGVLLQGKKNTEKMLKKATLSLVWRDLEAHGIFSPAEEERVAALLEMERLRAKYASSGAGDDGSQLLMDECELFDDYKDRLSYRISHSDDSDDGMLGTEGGWDFLARKEKSSHESVEMASDGTTPRRIRDGKFVFIDEESCIGCTQVCEPFRSQYNREQFLPRDVLLLCLRSCQCAQIAPSTFKMIEESGRARAYSQSNSLDIENAVMVSLKRIHCAFKIICLILFITDAENVERRAP